jgi:hypothetical protein
MSGEKGAGRARALGGVEGMAAVFGLEAWGWARRRAAELQAAAMASEGENEWWRDALAETSIAGYKNIDEWSPPCGWKAHERPRA